MQIKNGAVYLTKKEQLAVKTFLEHARTDLSWNENGSYGDAEKLYEKEYRLGHEGLRLIQFILDSLTTSALYLKKK